MLRRQRDHVAAVCGAGIGRAMLVLFSALVVVAGVTLPAGATTGAGHQGSSRFHAHDYEIPWNNAIEVPGTAGLNAGGGSSLNSISCTSQSECGGGGVYLDAAGKQQVYVTDERAGVWSAAIELPGMSTLNFANASLTSLSCSTPGNCSAVGDYTDATQAVQAFVVTETNGTWGNAMEAPGFGPLNVSGLGTALSVSCSSAGNCTAGGFFSNYFKQQIPFYVNEVNGSWGPTSYVGYTTGITEPLTAPSTSTVGSISCWGPNMCAGGGFYEDSSMHLQSLVYLNEVGFPAPSVQTLNAGGSSTITSVSCDAKGYCGAVGLYADGSGHAQAFAMNGGEAGFGTAVPIPVDGIRFGGVSGELTSVACPANNSCSAVGDYSDPSGEVHGFTVNETGGVWGSAQPLPNVLGFGPETELTSVSCDGAGDCMAGGLYGDVATNSFQALVMIAPKIGGWQPAIEAPGTASLDWAANASVLATSCSRDGYCAAVGTYLDESGNYQSFVTTTVLTRLRTPMQISMTVVKKVAAGHSNTYTFKLLASGLLEATGTVTFFRTMDPLCTARVAGGQATCTATTTFERKRQVVYASYSGDTLYAPTVQGKTLIFK